jgi:hypothetical protein
MPHGVADATRGDAKKRTGRREKVEKAAGHERSSESASHAEARWETHINTFEKVFTSRKPADEHERVNNLLGPSELILD